MSNRIHIGNCELCGAKAYFVSMNEMSWEGSSELECHHVLKKSKEEEGRSNGVSSDRRPNSPPVSSRSNTTDFGSGFRKRSEAEGHFPTEKEATYRAALNHLKNKCGAHIDKYGNDLTNVSEDLVKNEEEVEKQYKLLLDEVEKRKQAMLELLQQKKLERENILSEMRDSLQQYEEKCSKGMQDMWTIIQSQDETLEREQQCEKIARAIAMEIPILYSIPYQTKFNPKDMAQTNKLAASCGEVKFARLESKKKIEEFCWREIDRQWLLPNTVPNAAPNSVPSVKKPISTSNRNEQPAPKQTEPISSAGFGEHGEECKEHVPGQDTTDGDERVFQVEYMEITKEISIPKHECELGNLQKRVAEAFSLKNPPEALTFKVTGGGDGEENLDFTTYDPTFQVIHAVVSEVTPSKPKKSSSKKDKVKLFINNKSKIARMDFTDPQISFEAFKEQVRNKIKEEGNFNIQITNGPNRNQMVNSDETISLISCGEPQLEIKIVY